MRYLSPALEYIAFVWALGARVSSMNAWASSAYFALASGETAFLKALAKKFQLAAVATSALLVNTCSSPRSLSHTAVASTTLGS